MSHFRKFFKQSSFYFASHILVVLASFVSFPIFTRIFSTSEYGVFSLVIITVSLGIGFSKFGLQHAALRFHSDFKEKVIGLDMSYYYSTLLLSSVLMSGSIVLVFLFLTETFLSVYLSPLYVRLLPLIAFLMFIGGITNLLTMFMRADNRGALYSLFTVASRYGKLIIPLVVIFYFLRNVYGFFLGYAISEALLFTVLILIFIGKIRLKNVSFSFLKDALRYSFPLVWMELANLYLIFGDRYLLQYFMGSGAVGLYSAGYNISAMTQAMLTTPMRLAAIPMYLKIWNQDGEQETRKFLSTLLDYYFMLGIPIVVGLSWFSRDIITIFATSKFEESAIVIPLIIFAEVMYGSNVIFAAGLRIYKKTKILMYLSILAGTVNILLNIVLIPKFGILGAAIATVAAYLMLMSLIAYSSYRYMKIEVHVNNLLKYTLLSIVTVAAISFIPMINIEGIIVKLAAGLVLYGTFILALDREMKNRLLAVLR